VVGLVGRCLYFQDDLLNGNLVHPWLRVRFIHLLSVTWSPKLSIKLKAGRLKQISSTGLMVLRVFSVKKITNAKALLTTIKEEVN